MTLGTWRPFPTLSRPSPRAIPSLGHVSEGHGRGLASGFCQHPPPPGGRPPPTPRHSRDLNLHPVPTPTVQARGLPWTRAAARSSGSAGEGQSAVYRKTRVKSRLTPKDQRSLPPDTAPTRSSRPSPAPGSYPGGGPGGRVLASASWIQAPRGGHQRADCACLAPAGGAHTDPTSQQATGSAGGLPAQRLPAGQSEVQVPRTNFRQGHEGTPKLSVRDSL